MRHWLIVFSLLIAHPVGFGAEPFQEAEVTKKFNLVSFLFGRQSDRSLSAMLSRGIELSRREGIRVPNCSFLT